MVNWLDRFHKTRLGYVVFGLIELALAYASISWAIDSGTWFAYLLAVIFLIGCLQNGLRLVLTFMAKPKPRGKRRG